jgi:hypothetical protein
MLLELMVYSLTRLARHLPLQTALLLAPIAWCAHQIEEIAGGFR